MMVAAYIEQHEGSPPTIKQHLAAIRMLFDWLVTGQVIAFNPAASVGGPKHVVKVGKTPVLSVEETQALFEAIDVSTVAGLRDRALIGVMVFSFARVSAVVGTQVQDYYHQSRHSYFRRTRKVAATTSRRHTTRPRSSWIPTCKRLGSLKRRRLPSSAPVDADATAIN